MEPQSQTLVAADNLKLHFLRWEASGVPRFLTILVHGHGEHSGRYQGLADHFLEHGATVYAPDLRGHGRSEGKQGHVKSLDVYTRDLRQLVDSAREENPEVPVVLYGHSWGGAVAILYAQQNPETIDVAVFSAPMLRVTMPVPAWKVAMARTLSRVYPMKTLATGLDASYLSRNPEAVRAYREDPLIHDQMSAAAYVAWYDSVPRLMAAAGDLRVPFLIIHGDADPVIDPRGSVDFHSRARVAGAEIHLYEDGLHEPHNDTDAARVLADVDSYLNATLKNLRVQAREEARAQRVQAATEVKAAEISAELERSGAAESPAPPATATLAAETQEAAPRARAARRPREAAGAAASALELNRPTVRQPLRVGDPEPAAPPRARTRRAAAAAVPAPTAASAAESTAPEAAKRPARASRSAAAAVIDSPDLAASPTSRRTSRVAATAKKSGRAAAATTANATDKNPSTTRRRAAGAAATESKTATTATRRSAAGRAKDPVKPARRKSAEAAPTSTAGTRGSKPAGKSTGAASGTRRLKAAAGTATTANKSTTAGRTGKAAASTRSSGTTKAATTRAAKTTAASRTTKAATARSAKTAASGTTKAATTRSAKTRAASGTGAPRTRRTVAEKTATTSGRTTRKVTEPAGKATNGTRSRRTTPTKTSR